MEKVYKTFLKNDLNTNKIIGRTAFLHEERGVEIQHWLDNTNLLVDNFIIIDDDTDMLHLKDRLVHVDREVGFTDKDYKKAKQLLNK